MKPLDSDMKATTFSTAQLDRFLAMRENGEDIGQPTPSEGARTQEKLFGFGVGSEMLHSNSAFNTGSTQNGITKSQISDAKEDKKLHQIRAMQQVLATGNFLDNLIEDINIQLESNYKAIGVLQQRQQVIIQERNGLVTERDNIETQKSNLEKLREQQKAIVDDAKKSMDDMEDEHNSAMQEKNRAVRDVIRAVDPEQSKTSQEKLRKAEENLDRTEEELAQRREEFYEQKSTLQEIDKAIKKFDDRLEEIDEKLAKLDKEELDNQEQIAKFELENKELLEAKTILESDELRAQVERGELSRADVLEKLPEGVQQSLEQKIENFITNASDAAWEQVQSAGQTIKEGFNSVVDGVTNFITGAPEVAPNAALPNNEPRSGTTASRALDDNGINNTNVALNASFSNSAAGQTLPTPAQQQSFTPIAPSPGI